MHGAKSAGSSSLVLDIAAIARLPFHMGVAEQEQGRDRSAKAFALHGTVFCGTDLD
jgi:hypothetical protein